MQMEKTMNQKVLKHDEAWSLAFLYAGPDDPAYLADQAKAACADVELNQKLGAWEEAYERWLKNPTGENREGLKAAMADLLTEAGNSLQTAEEFRC